MTSQSRESVRAQQALWNSQARENAAHAILGDEAMLDPARRDAAFEAAAEIDARRLSRFLHPEASVVDLGCGIGRIMKPLAPLCREIVGVDISREMVERSRGYLADISNARVIETSGTNLPGINDASVDFVYSMLCLIHVDKRSAHAYFREISRVLKPDGRAYLQFHDILSSKGISKFEGVVGSDYPLEFYTREELILKFRRVGLSVLDIESCEEFLFVHVLKGDPHSWMQDFRNDIRLEACEGSGFFANPQRSWHDRGAVGVRIRNGGAIPRTLTATLSVLPVDGSPGGFHLRAEGIIVLHPSTTSELSIAYEGDGKTVTMLCDGRPVICGGSEGGKPPLRGPAFVALGLLPSGFLWNEATVAHFPSFFDVTKVEMT